MVEQRERIREELTGEVSVEHHLRIVRKCQRHLELFRNLGLLIIAVVTVSILVSDILATGRPAGWSHTFSVRETAGNYAGAPNGKCYDY